jgi:hypothetical protein
LFSFSTVCSANGFVFPPIYTLCGRLRMLLNLILPILPLEHNQARVGAEKAYLTPACSLVPAMF